MIVSFFGHSNYIGNSLDEKTVLDYLESVANGEDIEFYLGEYGAFDDFAYNCAKKYKTHHPGSKLIFITPYITPEHRRSVANNLNSRFDLILYPELEKIPLKYAIIHRNKWMVDKADLIITFIKRSFGGAYKTYRYAKQKGKPILNIAPYDIN